MPYRFSFCSADVHCELSSRFYEEGTWYLGKTNVFIITSTGNNNVT